MADESYLKLLEPHLAEAAGKGRPVVVMTCGIAGAGKSTLAKSIVAAHPSFERLCIDGIIASRHGLCGIDYPESEYATHQQEARQLFLQKTRELLAQGRNMALDRAFFAREDRDAYRALVRDSGGQCVLVYLKVDRGLLWKRICGRRSAGVDADSALNISEDLLDRYIAGFEAPAEDENAVVIAVEEKQGQHAS